VKICRITSAFVPPWKGLGPGPYELSLAQVKQGHNVTVITKHVSGCEEFDRTIPFEIHRIKARYNLVFSFLSALKFLSFHLKNRFDILHNHGDSALVLLLLRCLLPIHIPIVTSVHIIRKTQDLIIRDSDPYKVVRKVLGNKITGNFPQPKSSKRELLFERIYLTLSDVLAVVSEGLKADIKNTYGITGKVAVILNGVNAEKFNNNINHLEESQRIRVELGCKQLLLFVGVLNGRKGEFDLIMAMKNVVSKYPDSKLLIIGDGPTRELTMKMVQALSLEDNVEFIANITYSEMPKYYMASDLFVLPSYSEGLPKVLLEAMASGTPVVVSDIPGQKELIGNNKAGRLVRVGDVSDLTSVIVKILSDGELRKRVSLEAKTLIEKKISWEAVAKRLDHVYKDVVEYGLTGNLIGMELDKTKFIKWAEIGFKQNFRINRHLYDQRDIEGRNILDIGAGNGERSGAFILFFGAALSDAVDLWGGGGDSKTSAFEQILYLKDEILGRKLCVIKRDICEFSAKKKYGFIFAHSSLHHIFKSKKRLKKDRNLEKKVIYLFRKIGGWLEADGKFMIFETARRNWTPIPKYRKRFKMVDLSTKQDPWGWSSALKKAGFKEIHITYPAPVILDRYKGIHWVFDNYLMSVLTGSSYLIEACNFHKYSEKKGGE